MTARRHVVGKFTALEMFQRGFSTVEIAKASGLSEAVIYNEIHHCREERLRLRALAGDRLKRGFTGRETVAGT